MARFVSFAVGGVPPEIMGIGPVVAIPKALKLAGLKLEDIGVVELNEAFAVQALAVDRECGLNMDTLNLNGGAIALGHPLGCTGAKLDGDDPARDAAPERPLWNGHDVHRRRTGRRRHFRKVELIFMATMTVAIPKTKGGAFLIESREPESIFTPEDFTDEHRAIAKTTEEFWNKEVLPHREQIRHGEHALCAAILRKSAELGLTAVVIPEKFGGMEMDLTSMMVVGRGRGARRVVFGLARRAHRHRHAAAAAVRN